MTLIIETISDEKTETILGSTNQGGGDDFKTNDLEDALPAAVMTSKIETNSDEKTTMQKDKALVTYLYESNKFWRISRCFFRGGVFLQSSYFLSSQLIFIKMTIYGIIIWKANKIILEVFR